MSQKVIAIDGPGGAGKSTAARLLAKKLNYDYLDTGAMYRAVTLEALNRGIDVNDKMALTGLAEEINISFSENRVYLNNRDVTGLIRKTEIDQNVSYVARIKGVREAMVNLQRKMARKGGIIVDGRDIGSNVLPDADLKIYLTAALEERARRRYKDLKINEDISFTDVKNHLKKRDMLDKKREISPLIKADDAVVVDTTDLNIEEVVQELLKIFAKE